MITQLLPSSGLQAHMIYFDDQTDTDETDGFSSQH